MRDFSCSFRRRLRTTIAGFVRRTAACNSSSGARHSLPAVAIGRTALRLARRRFHACHVALSSGRMLQCLVKPDRSCRECVGRRPARCSLVPMMRSDCGCLRCLNCYPWREPSLPRLCVSFHAASSRIQVTVACLVDVRIYLAILSLPLFPRLLCRSSVSWHLTSVCSPCRPHYARWLGRSWCPGAGVRKLRRGTRMKRQRRCGDRPSQPTSRGRAADDLALVELFLGSA